MAKLAQHRSDLRFSALLARVYPDDPTIGLITGLFVLVMLGIEWRRGTLERIGGRTRAARGRRVGLRRLGQLMPFFGKRDSATREQWQGEARETPGSDVNLFGR